MSFRGNGDSDEGEEGRKGSESARGSQVPPRGTCGGRGPGDPSPVRKLRLYPARSGDNVRQNNMEGARDVCLEICGTFLDSFRNDQVPAEARPGYIKAALVAAMVLTGVNMSLDISNRWAQDSLPG